MHTGRVIVADDILGGKSFSSYLAWTGLAVAYGMVAPIMVQNVSIFAAGSGTPELKCMISGVVMDQYLDVKTMIAKTLGIISTAGSGLWVGKVGPVVQVTAGFAYQLLAPNHA